ncbi:hypothetical protein TorRG33x02_059970 [Trema orientale]|uniref:Uncharacterized protein n=1 Tax=Trema orientale TaxID=63057 RepID=A0A2P5FK62_TREOI|nr:hypothetical protein TorRG33x02_059970 [Trema orientale]
MPYLGGERNNLIGVFYSSDDIQGDDERTELLHSLGIEGEVIEDDRGQVETCSDGWVFVETSL